MSAVQDDVTSLVNWDVELGAAARLLHHRGHTDAVMLLLEVQDVDCQWAYDDWSINYYTYFMQVDLAFIDLLTSEIEEQIKEALNAVLRMSKQGCGTVVLVPHMVDQGDWRSELKGAVYGKPVNQATLIALPQRYPTKDRMRFRDAGELAVYDGLLRTQARSSSGDTITIVPNPSVRVKGHTWEPDFLVAFGGKCGLIEVDGASHSNRWAADKSKDSIYEDCGIAYIARIPVEDTNDPGAVDLFVDRFLKRLLG